MTTTPARPKHPLAHLATVAALCTLTTTGCIHHWVRIDSVARVHDESIRVERRDGTTEVLDHVRACGPATVGGTRPGEPAPCTCATTCHLVDVVHDRVKVRRINGWATAGLITGIVAVAFVGLVAWAVAAAGVAGG